MKVARLDDPEFVRRIDAALPQTQCRRCGYDACLPYAEAVAAGVAINRCPPGGDTVIAALAALTGRPVVPLDGTRGKHALLAVARIDETWCIGCTKCIDACPVDAIVGGAKRMHVVLTALCTGCELCLPPCPVDCIDMMPAGRAWSPADANAARERLEARARRDESRRTNSSIDSVFGQATDGPAARPSKADAAAAALARARERRATMRNRSP